MDIVSGNAVNWLDCVAKGQQVTLKPIARDKEDLVSTVLLHLPQKKVLIIYKSYKDLNILKFYILMIPIKLTNLPSLILQTKTVETLDIGKKLIELGFAKASVPQDIKKKTIESQLAPVLLTAESRAKSYRNGIWSEKLPPIPLYVIYWRKGTQLTTDIIILSFKKLFQLLAFVSKGALVGGKYLIQRPFRTSKSVQTT